MTPSSARQNRPGVGIFFIVLAMTAITINDTLFKKLSGEYPLHEMVFVRSIIAICFSFLILKYEGGLTLLKTTTPFQHALRGFLIVCSNLFYFSALAVLPLGDAMALFFVAPLFITVLSIFILGERIALMRMSALLVGFAGVVIMMEPWKSGATRDVHLWVLLLPVAAALTYAINQVLTRKLGVTTKASALAIYIQGSFIVISLIFLTVAGDGKYVDSFDNDSARFLLRAWVWPSGDDWYWFAAIGANASVIGYSISQAYRMADAATVAPFEYAGLPMAILWGWVVFGDFPSSIVWLGIALIVGSGLFVFARERQKATRVARSKRKYRR